MVGGVGLHIVQPVLYLLKALPVCNIIDEDGPLSSPVVAGSERTSEPLLTRCVEDFHLRLGAADSDLLRLEVYAVSGSNRSIEFLVCESDQEGGLANVWLAHGDDLNIDRCSRLLPSFVHLDKNAKVTHGCN